MTTWDLLCVHVPAANVELVADYLWSRGVIAIEEIEHEHQIELRTSVGVGHDELVQDLLICFPGIRIDNATVDRSIADTWRQHVGPIVVDESLTIAPSWCDNSIVHASDDNDITVFIDPEDVFGLGNHPTTVGTLIMARKYIAPHSEVFDYGTGSGVLAVAMARSHSCAVGAYDIAPTSKVVVERNAVRNGVNVAWVDIPTQIHDNAHRYDAVLANILAPVLIEVAPHITQLVKKRGVVILSGTRDDQWPKVVNEYHATTMIDTVSIEGWTTVVLRVN